MPDLSYLSSRIAGTAAMARIDFVASLRKALQS